MLKTKAQDMFRYKGVMAVKGMDTKFVFQGGAFGNRALMIWMGFWKLGLSELIGKLLKVDGFERHNNMGLSENRVYSQ